MKTVSTESVPAVINENPKFSCVEENKLLILLTGFVMKVIKEWPKMTQEMLESALHEIHPYIYHRDQQEVQVK